VVARIQPSHLFRPPVLAGAALVASQNEPTALARRKNQVGASTHLLDQEARQWMSGAARHQRQHDVFDRDAAVFGNSAGGPSSSGCGRHEPEEAPRAVRIR
jgi:hypothetical protein